MTKGTDSLGKPFEGTRRYNEFFQLRELLRSFWPGLFIPAIPSKKMVGNKDVKFILERRYFLERFVMQMSQYKYLLSGQQY
jgi:sorting nexin-1/2